MSKRFGRNQKRRMKEEIADLKTTNVIKGHLISHLEKQVREANDTVAEMVECIEGIAPHSVAIPPKRVAGAYAADSREIPFCTHRPYLHEEPALRTIDYRSVSIHALRLFLEDHRDQFNTALHLEYHHAGKVGYMISTRALDAVPVEVLARRVAREMVGLLKTHLNERGS